MIEQQKLELFNHWWIENKVDEKLALPFKRECYKEIKESLNKRFITSLTGLRRVGKTTIMYQLIEELIKNKTNKINILFFSFDERKATLNEVIESYKEFQKKDFRKEKVYIFLDEIQKCSNWENEIKKYYDLFPQIKFIISGSESLFIKKKTKETLAGRILEYRIKTFSFKEFLLLKGIKEEDFKYETKIKPLFNEYILKGGFPETFFLESEKEYNEYIRSLVVDKIIYKDIPQSFKIEDPGFLGVLLELIATNPGIYLDYQSLGKQFQKDRRVIKKYIEYLEKSFLIRILGNYQKTRISTLRKIKRAYPSDNSLIKIYIPQIKDDFFGKMIETAVINKIEGDSFWKEKREIDVIKNTLPIEIKYQEQINEEDFAPLKYFMKKFKQKKALLISKSQEKEITTKEGKIKLIPAWKWFLEPYIL